MDKSIPILSTSETTPQVANQPHLWREAGADLPHLGQTRAPPHHPHPLLLLLNSIILIIYA